MVKWLYGLVKAFMQRSYSKGCWHEVIRVRFQFVALLKKKEGLG